MPSRSTTRRAASPPTTSVSTGLSRRHHVKTILFEQESKLISFFGRANYNINDRYLSRLSAAPRRLVALRGRQPLGHLPVRSVAWRLSQEPFLRDFKGLSDLKLRASWAKTGNQAFGNYLA